MSKPPDRLADAVQANCNVSDARHARNMTLCTYLLEMRELYRWERGIPLTETLKRADVGAWLAGRESSWEALEERPYVPVPVDGALVDPFDAPSVNRTLVPRGQVYGAGIGRFGKPQFHLAELVREEWRDGTRILVSGREHARDLSAAPAALSGDTIHVRLEALQRVLWEKAEAWSGRRRDGALASALDAYGFAADPGAALRTMARAEAETLILHELGEREAGRSLGPDWASMLASFTHRRAEVFVRAARDHLADCTTTLPTLLERDAAASIHFWFANLDGMRRELFPRIAAAYRAWCAGDDRGALAAAASSGAAHWRTVCADALALFRERGDDAETSIEALAAVDSTRL